jgi:hypothetical protein
MVLCTSVGASPRRGDAFTLTTDSQMYLTEPDEQLYAFVCTSPGVCPCACLLLACARAYWKVVADVPTAAPPASAHAPLSLSPPPPSLSLFRSWWHRCISARSMTFTRAVLCARCVSRT